MLCQSGSFVYSAVERCPSGRRSRSRKSVGAVTCLVGSNPTLSATDSSPSSPERCWSGRSGTPGKRVGAQVPRGFESHPLRHDHANPTPPIVHTFYACYGERMQRSSIEWTDATWNPVTGCTEVSPGCAHCYAKTFAERFRGVPGHPYERGFDLQLRPERLDQPLRWKKPRSIFVNSMSDLFHEDVPDEYIREIFDVMATRRPSPLPGPHQARRAPCRAGPIAPVARSRLDGRVGREPALDIADRLSA